MSKAWTVSQLNSRVSQLLSQTTDLQNLSVIGELSGAKAYPSGHFYFTLKDAEAAVSCVMFRQAFSRLSFAPQNGDSVLLRGQVALYEKDGRFQLYVQSMEKAGQGDLWQAYESLKRRYQALGYFDPERKKDLPFLPRKIALISSAAGAVLHDVLHILRRRFPGFTLVLLPVAVQGQGAATQIAAAVQCADGLPDVDVIVLARGGGSMEDLWAFNEAVVAEAIYRAKRPVVSAIGHEVDFALSDFVADLRAPTPSAAAELLFPERQALLNQLLQLQARLVRAFQQRLQREGENLRVWTERPVLQNFTMSLALRAERLDYTEEQMRQKWQWRLKDERSRLENLRLRLLAFDPRQGLKQGYALLRNGEGVILSEIAELSLGQHLCLELRDGEAELEVVEIKGHPSADREEEKHGRIEL